MQPGRSRLAKPCSDFQALTSAWSVDGDGDLLLDPARVLPQLALRPVRVAVAPAHRLRLERVKYGSNGSDQGYALNSDLNYN